jgi:hypothetical protein
MAENQGEALATISEITQGHGDVPAMLGAASRSPLERLAAAWWAEVDDAVTWRPYSAAATALAVGFLGGLAIALSARNRRW